jgi:hypothetical protein
MVSQRAATYSLAHASVARQEASISSRAAVGERTQRVIRRAAGMRLQYRATINPEMPPPSALDASGQLRLL